MQDVSRSTFLRSNSGAVVAPFSYVGSTGRSGLAGLPITRTGEPLREVRARRDSREPSGEDGGRSGGEPESERNSEAECTAPLSEDTLGLAVRGRTTKKNETPGVSGKRA